MQKLEGKVSPIDTQDDEGMSLLHCAEWGGHVTTMRRLIRRGCDVDSVDGSGLTSLHLAAANGLTKAVRELIRNGASKSAVAGNCGTPLPQEALSGHVETAVATLEEVAECQGDRATASIGASWSGCSNNMQLAHGHLYAL